MKRVGILGAGGFTGQMLIRLLSHHPEVSVVFISSGEYAGKSLADALPAMDSIKYKGLSFTRHPDSIEHFPDADVYFLATPDSVSLTWAPQLVERGYKVIDISGAFRIKDAAVFEKAYKLKHNAPEALLQAAYGIPEINRNRIASASLVANPGCYASAALLSLYPLSAFPPDTFGMPVLDGKSGTSGAGGRAEKDALPFSGVYENFRAYKVQGHQHEPEIRQEFASFMGNPAASLRFTPHLIPMYQGIFMSTYIPVASPENFSIEKLRKSADDFAHRELFVRHYNDPNEIETRKVRLTNFADISYHYDPEHQLLIAVSAIDNLMKGAAGVAVQNLNLLFGFPEEMALL